MFGLVITTNKRLEEQVKERLESELKEERRRVFGLGRELGYTEALNVRLLYILQPPDALEQAEDILKQKGSR